MPDTLFKFSSTDLYQIWLAIINEAPGTGNATAANQVIQINQLSETSPQLSVFKDDTTHESVFKDDAGQGLFLAHDTQVSVFTDTTGSSNFNDAITTNSVFKNSDGHTVFIDPEDGTVWLQKISEGINSGLTDGETGNPYLLEVLDKLTATNVQPSVFKDANHDSVFTDPATNLSFFISPEDGSNLVYEIYSIVDRLLERNYSGNVTTSHSVTADTAVNLAAAIAADIAATEMSVFNIINVAEIAPGTYSAIITYSTL